MARLGCALAFLVCSSSVIFAHSTDANCKELQRKELPIKPMQLHADAARIEQKEQNIRDLHERYQSEGYSAQSFYENIINPLHQGESLNEAWLNEFEKRYGHLHKERYAEIAAKQHLLMVATHNYLLMLEEELLGNKAKLSSDERELKKSFNHLQETFIKWAADSDAIGDGALQKEQARRMYAFGGYFKSLRALFQKLGFAPKLKSSTAESVGAWEKTKNNSLFVANGAASVSRVLWKAYVHQKKKVEKNSTPLFTGEHGVNAAFKRLAAAQGYHLTIEGQEHLASLPLEGVSDRKVVNLFLPAHRHDFKDVMALARLDLPHYLLFANPGSFAKFRTPAISLPFYKKPPSDVTFFAKAVAAQREIIPVGSVLGTEATPKRTMEQFFESLGLGISPNVVNYPQGFVANAGELAAFSPSVVRELFGKILAHEGYELNLIPVSYETDSTFLSETGDVDDHEIVVKIHPPLLHKAVSALVQHQLDKPAGDEVRYIEHFFATLWFESITQHGELTWAELQQRLEKALGFSFGTAADGGNFYHVPLQQQKAS